MSRLLLAISLLLAGCSSPSESRFAQREREANVQLEKCVRRYLPLPDGAPFPVPEQVYYDPEGEVWVLGSTIQVQKAAHTYGVVIVLEDKSWKVAECTIDGKTVQSDEKLLARVTSRLKDRKAADGAPGK